MKKFFVMFALMVAGVLATMTTIFYQPTVAASDVGTIDIDIETMEKPQDVIVTEENSSVKTLKEADLKAIEIFNQIRYGLITEEEGFDLLNTLVYEFADNSDSEEDVMTFTGDLEVFKYYLDSDEDPDEFIQILINQ